MAFTIQAIPPDYSSLHGDLVYTVAYPEHTGDPVTYPNYKFIADVYVAGELIARLKKVQDPATGIGIFNIGQVVRSYLKTVFNPTSGLLVAQVLADQSFYLKIGIRFGEEYGFTSYYRIVRTPDLRKFFNNYNARLVGASSSLQAKANKIASNRPSSGEVLLSSNFMFLPYFPVTPESLNDFFPLIPLYIPADPTFSEVDIIVTPQGGGSVYETTITAENASLQLLNVSPGALNALQPGTITSNTRSYSVAIGSQTYMFKVICEAQHQVYTLHFLNQYGGFDTKMFTKVSRTQYPIERKSFGKLPYTVDSNGAVSYANPNGVYNETTSVYSVQERERLTLNSDLLTNEEYIWLRDLLFSPMVYLEDSGYFIPVTITETNYEPKKNINDDLTNLTLTVEFGQQLNAQFR